MRNSYWMSGPHATRQAKRFLSKTGTTAAQRAPLNNQEKKKKTVRDPVSAEPHQSIENQRTITKGRPHKARIVENSEGSRATRRNSKKENQSKISKNQSKTDNHGDPATDSSVRHELLLQHSKRRKGRWIETDNSGVKKEDQQQSKEKCGHHQAKTQSEKRKGNQKHRATKTENKPQQVKKRELERCSHYPETNPAKTNKRNMKKES